MCSRLNSNAAFVNDVFTSVSGTSTVARFLAPVRAFQKLLICDFHTKNDPLSGSSADRNASLMRDQRRVAYHNSNKHSWREYRGEKKSISNTHNSSNHEADELHKQKTWRSGSSPENLRLGSPKTWRMKTGKTSPTFF